MKHYDVIIIGAGAAGLTAARAATKRGRHVAVLDMGAAPARKVMQSGGGRCNITNAAVGRDRYFGCNPDFIRGAIARIRPTDILEWMNNHNLSAAEKSAGQYFCAQGSTAVVRALIQDAADADIILNTTVRDITKESDKFIVHCDKAAYECESVIIANGGTSFASLGVSDIGQKIAKKFGHKIIPTRPALCAIATDAFPTDFAGIAMPAKVSIGREVIYDDMLFTHFGVGGPAIYRATVRDISGGITIDLLPDVNVLELLRDAKKNQGRKNPATILGAYMPMRIAKWIVGSTDKNIADYKDTELCNISDKIQQINISAGNMRLHNLASAEIVRGGVDTSDVSSKTMESKLCSGLFLAGEVLDIAGDLGGFNLHWAWASGTVAGQNA